VSTRRRRQRPTAGSAFLNYVFKQTGVLATTCSL
jgi:hypothetical protein